MNRAHQDEDTLDEPIEPEEPSLESAGSSGSVDHRDDHGKKRSASGRRTGYEQGDGTATPTSRPSLLALSSAFGKSSSTSSTSATTVPRVQRSVSSRSIAGHKSTPASPNPRGKAVNAVDTSSTLRSGPFISVSLPPSPTANEHAPQLQGTGSPLTIQDNSEKADTPNEAKDESHDSEDRAGTAVSLLTAETDVFSDDDDQPVAEGELVARPSQGDLDPRVVLREQLRRSKSSRLSFHSRRGRADSYKSSKSATGSLRSALAANPWAKEVTRSSQTFDDGESIRPHIDSQTYGGANLRPRRYFVLTSAGKPVFASQSNWRKRRQDHANLAKQANIEDELSEAHLQSTEEDSDEVLTSLVGVIQAIISLYAVENDMIRYIDAGDMRIAFHLKAPIYLVAVSDWREPETQLEYLYMGIISVTTQASINSIFKQRSNFDLRRLLAGTDNILNGVLQGLQETALHGDRLLEAMSGSLKVVPFLASLNASAQAGDGMVGTVNDNVEGLRDECTRALRPPKKHRGILYALLVSQSSLITLIRPKDHSIHPADLHILLSTIASTDALRLPNSESWIPICLPRFNSRGFLHAFVSYVDSQAEASEPVSRTKEETERESNLGLGIILVTAEKEGFFDMKAWKDEIVKQLLRTPTGLSSTISSAPSDSLYTRLIKAIVPSPLAPNATQQEPATFQSQSFLPVTHQPYIQPVKHFWYKSKTHVQIFTPFCPRGTSASDPATSFSGIYAASAMRRQGLLAQYLNIRDALHSTINRTMFDASHKLVYLATGEEAILGLSTTSYELYVCLPAHTRKDTATEAAHALARWIRKYERRIFLTGSSSF